MATGRPLYRRATLETAIRRFQGCAARRAYTGRAWRARVKLWGVLHHFLPYAYASEVASAAASFSAVAASMASKFKKTNYILVCLR
jgi:hypothetical protein